MMMCARTHRAFTPMAALQEALFREKLMKRSQAHLKHNSSMYIASRSILSLLKIASLIKVQRVAVCGTVTSSVHIEHCSNPL